jgi:hypothetical protein
VTTLKFNTNAVTFVTSFEPGVQNIKKHTRDVPRMSLQCKFRWSLYHLRPCTNDHTENIGLMKIAVCYPTSLLCCICLTKAKAIVKAHEVNHYTTRLAFRIGVTLSPSGRTSSKAHTARREPAQYPFDNISWTLLLYHSSRMYHQLDLARDFPTSRLHHDSIEPRMQPTVANSRVPCTAGIWKMG